VLGVGAERIPVLDRLGDAREQAVAWAPGQVVFFTSEDRPDRSAPPRGCRNG
jgi:hypothetical protein